MKKICFFCKTPIVRLPKIQGYGGRVAHQVCYDKASYDNKCTFKADTVG